MDPSEAEGSSSKYDEASSAAPHRQPEKTSQSDPAKPQRPPPMQPVPVFLDRTYTMVDTSSDDVVSWSEAGDSFIIRQVGAQNLGAKLGHQFFFFTEIFLASFLILFVLLLLLFL